MAMGILSAHQAATADMQAAPPCSGRILPQQTPVMLAALNPTRTRWTGHLARPTVCRHTTRWRTSCGPPEVAAGIGLGAMFGCVRHCRRDDVVGSTTGQPRPFLLEERDKQGIHWGGASPLDRLITDQTGATGGSQPHTHTLSGASEEASSLPPYYTLAYIMRCA